MAIAWHSSSSSGRTQRHGEIELCSKLGEWVPHSDGSWVGVKVGVCSWVLSTFGAAVLFASSHKFFLRLPWIAQEVDAGRHGHAWLCTSGWPCQQFSWASGSLDSAALPWLMPYSREWSSVQLCRINCLPVTHFVLVDIWILTDIHTSQLRCALWPEINYKHTRKIHFQGITDNI